MRLKYFSTEAGESQGSATRTCMPWLALHFSLMISCSKPCSEPVALCGDFAPKTRTESFSIVCDFQRHVELFLGGRTAILLAR
jgi:hypothetical protein